MKKRKEERPYEKVKTSEMMDELAKGIDYSNPPEANKRTEYQEELDLRPPFTHIKKEMERMLKRINELETWAKQMSNHSHDQNGNVMIPLKSIERR
jgi:anion-transporting  ArsA/GET3 family ATPase